MRKLMTIGIVAITLAAGAAHSLAQSRPVGGGPEGTPARGEAGPGRPERRERAERGERVERERRVEGEVSENSGPRAPRAARAGDQPSGPASPDVQAQIQRLAHRIEMLQQQINERSHRQDTRADDDRNDRGERKADRANRAGKGERKHASGGKHKHRGAMARPAVRRAVIARMMHHRAQQFGRGGFHGGPGGQGGPGGPGQMSQQFGSGMGQRFGAMGGGTVPRPDFAPGNFGARGQSQGPAGMQRGLGGPDTRGPGAQQFQERRFEAAPDGRNDSRPRRERDDREERDDRDDRRGPAGPRGPRASADHAS